MENYVKTIDLHISPKLLKELQEKGFSISHPPFTEFQAKKEGISCTLYASGKLVVQGKNAPEFIEFFLEPEILLSFDYNSPPTRSTFIPHIGIDESGKGDFFGPLCIAGVFVEPHQLDSLHKAGVKDSKTITDLNIRKIALQIRKICQYHIVRINPPKYNEIYQHFKNLNKLLAWGHATAIEHLMEKSHCSTIIVDQFADESVVELALKRKKLEVHLTQRHRAEEDIAVAAASILAREAFLEGMNVLSEELGISLPKGCSESVKKTAAQILRKWGAEKLKSVCKQHFKTLNMVLEKELR